MPPSIRTMLTSSSRRFGLDLGFQFAEPFLRFLEKLAPLELLHELLEVGQSLGVQFYLDQRFGEVEVHGVAARVVGVLFQQILEAIDRARIPALAKVKEADEIIGLAQPIARFAQL